MLKFKYCLRTRLLILVLLVAIIPMAFLGYSGYSNTKKFIAEKEEEKVKSFFNEIRGMMIKFFNNSYRDISFLSNVIEKRLSYSYEEIDSASKEEIESLFIDFSKNNIQYDQIRFIDKEGYEIIRVNNNEGSIYVVPNEELQYKGDNYYFKEVSSLRSKEIYISSIDLNRENGKLEEPFKPIIRYMSPVYIEDDLKGFLALNLNVGYLLNDIKRRKLENDYENMMLIDDEGFYLLHSNDEKEWGNVYSLGTGENFKKDYSLIYEEVYEGKTLRIKNDGMEMQTWYPVELKGIDNKKIVMFMELKERNYLLPLKNFKNLFMFQVTISIAALILGGIMISYYITRPVIKIVKAVEDIGKGHFDVEIEIDTGDELELLGYEIKKMSYELKDMYKNMEEIVTERTKELQRAHQELEDMATKDSLTGLYNRHYFNQYIQNVDQNNIHRNLMILIIDVDKFKYINDNYGHNIGDVVLKAVAKILKDSARERDIAVRYGGDEFLVALYDSRKELAEKYIERVMKNLKEWNNNSNILKHELTLSMGYNQYDGEAHILEVINNADKMMYDNKMAKRRKELE
ncbi:diguanylate cyclase [Wukongibacter sp. M2B1]|uniref:sensor domain-containing diguanylate cyclase n=1 Tax=Wukongibacter sp. M2B1 TaxID=3088895 RepID=UPI003D7A39B7